jgi:hypothetical protein
MSIQWTTVQLARLKRFFIVLAGSGLVFSEWERLVIDHRVSGKKAHDAHLVAIMNLNAVTHILTLNAADFSRYPGITVLDPRLLPSHSGGGATPLNKET